MNHPTTNDLPSPTDAPSAPPVPGSLPTLPGRFAVGAVSTFVRDPTREFDRWGSTYKNEDVRALIEEVRAAGDPQVVPIEIHYPVEADPAAVLDGSVQPARVLPCADPTAALATNLDYFHGDQALYASVLSGQLAELGDPAAPLELGRVEAEDRRSHLGVAPAPGRFPVVVLCPGLFGVARQWTAAAEHLASHGYVVVSASFISDSRTPLVFHDPDSAYAAEFGADEVAAAEQRFGADDPVFRNFFDLGWGAPMPADPAQLDPSSLTAIEGGAAAIATMMGDLFQQRVHDIAAILEHLRVLSLPEDQCRAQLGPGTRAARLSGLFEGHIDVARVGVMGHSLGSITAQVASVQLDAVKATVGLNNGLPSTWEPGDGFPNRSDAPDRPDGVTKPIAFLSGAEDDFVDFVFRKLFLDLWTMTGGDPTEMFPLRAERQTPTHANPLPIVASSYARARGPKLSVLAADVEHTIYGDTLGANIPYHLTKDRVRGSTRFAKGDDRLDPAFEGEAYDLLGWRGNERGERVYVPHQLRNHYAVAMFETYVKGVSTFADALTTTQFDTYAIVVHDGLG